LRKVCLNDNTSGINSFHLKFKKRSNKQTNLKNLILWRQFVINLKV